MSTLSMKAVTDADTRAGTGKHVPAAPAGNARAHRDFLLWGAIQGLLMVLAAACLTFIAFGRDLLPAKYSYDSNTIASVARGHVQLENDPSFENVGNLYRLLGLADAPVLAGLLGFGVFVLVVQAVATRDIAPAYPAAGAALVVVSLVPGAVYLGQYSKDVLVLLITALALRRAGSGRFELLLVTTMLVYAAVFRNYWFLAIALYVVLRLMMRRTTSLSRIFLVMVLALGVLAFLFPLLVGVEMSSTREGINEFREGSVDAQTAITGAVPLEGSVGDWVNTTLVLLSLAVPFPLLLTGSPIHALLAMFFVLLWWTFLRSATTVVSAPDADPRARRAVALVLSFALVQSIFEPDYGSYIRHLTPLLPLMLAAVAWERIRTTATAKARQLPRRRSAGAGDRGSGVRVLHAVQQLSRGGAESIVLALKEGGEAHGHEVAVAAAPGNWSEPFGSPVFELPILERRARAVPAASWSLGRAIRAWRPDVVHAHNPGMAVITALATGRARRPPAVVTDHGVFGVDYARVGRVLRLAGLPVVACGPAVADALARHGCQVTVTIPNGVAPPPPPMTAEEVRDRFGLTAGRRLLVSVGRLTAQKRHDRSVRALAQLPGTDLLILGEGEDRPALEALVHELALEDRVRMPGNVPDARRAVGAADAW
ncbi:glycosyltransferase [Georgenia sp. SUBG003]|uniref:glycosyltransferase n=1 Tax=Georgenia sp. SUBG003 TaxID=1497974 RepID=UPI0006948A06